MWILNYNFMKNIENLYEQLLDVLSEMICTSTAVMAPYPTPVVGSTNHKYTKEKSKRKQKVADIKKAIVEAFEGAKQNKGSQKKAMLGYRYKKQWSKNMDINEKILEIAEVCEAIINEEGVADKVKQFFHIEPHHPSYNTPIAKELRDKQSNLDKISDQADAYHNRAERATGHRKQVNQENAMDKEKEYRQANKEYRHLKGHVLDYFRGKGDPNPEAHDKLKKMTEAVEELFSTYEALRELQGE